MKYSKEHILSEVRKAASANNGVPPGYRTFSKVTGIRPTDWLGRYWIRWNDLIKEAGFETREKNLAIDDEILLEKLVLFIREIGQYPLFAHFRMKSRESEGFPDQKTFSKKFGPKSEMAAKVVVWCESRNGFEDVAGLCRVVIAGIKKHRHGFIDST